MKKFRPLPLLLCFCLLTGCAAGHSPQAVSPPLGSLPPVKELSCTAQEAAAGYSAFAVELLRQARQEGENTLLSPLSVTLALAMTANGAVGDTLTEFETLFGLSRENLNALCARFLTDYTQLGGSTEAALANSLWADPELTLEENFILRCQETYGAQLFQQDLQTPAAVEAVNGWVEEATRGMIPSLVDRFDEETVLALVNAIYLKNRFQKPFDTPQSDWEMDFTAADGRVGHPKGMSNGTRNEEYMETDRGQGVLLPYDDGRLALLLVLPPEGESLTDALAQWEDSTISDFLAARREALVSLTCPKFETEWGDSLAGVLSSMGLSGAFDPNHADFTALGHSENGPLYIGDVIHKTAFALHEKGTEAAAVTAVMMDAKSDMPPEELISLRFDRPFVYAIVDTELGVPLFLGTAESL